MGGSEDASGSGDGGDARPPFPALQPPQVGGMGFLLLRPRIGMLPRGPPLSPPRRLYSSEPSRFTSKVEDKFEQFNSMRKQFKVKATLEVEDKLRQFKAMREQFKLYLAALLRASFSCMKKIVVKMLGTMKRLAINSAQEVVAGYKAYVSQSYFMCFLIAVLAIGVWFSDSLHLLKFEGDESYVDRLDARLQELQKEFPQKVALCAFFLNLAIMILNEIITTRKELTVDLNKRIEDLKQMIEDLEEENRATKAELREKTTMLKDLDEQIVELKAAMKSTEKKK